MKFTRKKTYPTLSSLQLIVFDFDGVFTDDKVYVDEYGKESVACSRTDGFGIARLLSELQRGHYPTKVIVVSTETNKVVIARCKKMSLDCHTGVTNKEQFIRNFAGSNNIDLNFSLYAGNDLNDYSAMKLFGYRFAPANAHPRVKDLATFNLKSYGGNGYVRELIECIAPGSFVEKPSLPPG